MRLCITRPKPVSTLRSLEPDEMRHLPTSVAPPLPLHTRSSGPCSSPHPCRQSCSFVHLCCAPRRQASPGCKERPIYLSGRRRAELRRHPNGEKNPTPYIFHVVLWSHCLTMSIVYFGWIWPSRPRAQRKPVPWVCKANPPRPRAVVVISEIGLCQDPPRIDRTTPFLSGPCGFRPGACV